MESNADLAAFLATGCERLGVPGCAVGVIAGGRHVVTCHGVTDVRHPRAVDADTLFPIGSTTKTLTATALMSLVHDGSLSLDNPVVRHLPDFAPADPAVRDVVTVGQLFDHTAGWRGDIEADTGWGEDAIELAVREVLPRARQVFPPGATASYNNLSLVVAGRLLERVTGTSYEAVIRARVLEPLGMSATYFFPWEVATRPIATGHVPGDDGLAPAYTWPIPRGMNPAGGAISSVRDQLAYAQFHLDGHAAGTAPVSDQLRVAMQQPRVAMPSMLTGVGLSWLLKDRDGLRLVTHGGNCSNLFVSAFAIAPDEGFAVTVLTNSRGGTPLGASVTDWAIEHYLGRRPVSQVTPLPLTAGLIAEYAGRYDAGDWDWRVTTDDGRLFVGMDLTEIPPDTPEEVLAAFRQPPTEVVLVAPDVLAPAAAPAQSVGDFVRDDEGRIEFLRYGLRMAARRI